MSKECLGITKKGLRCKNIVTEGDYCHLHKNQNTEKKTVTKKVTEKVIKNPFTGHVTEAFVLKVLDHDIYVPKIKKVKTKWTVDKEAMDKLLTMLNKLYSNIIDTAMNLAKEKKLDKIDEEVEKKAIQENLPKVLANYIIHNFKEFQRKVWTNFFTKNTDVGRYITKTMIVILRNIFELVVSKKMDIFESKSTIKFNISKKEITDVVKNPTESEYTSNPREITSQLYLLFG